MKVWGGDGSWGVMCFKLKQELLNKNSLLSFCWFIIEWESVCSLAITLCGNLMEFSVCLFPLVLWANSMESLGLAMTETGRVTNANLWLKLMVFGNNVNHFGLFRSTFDRQMSSPWRKETWFYIIQPCSIIVPARNKCVWWICGTQSRSSYTVSIRM